MRLSNVFLRGIPGAYLLQSGYGKLGMDAESAEGLKGFAATGVPQFADWDAKTFTTFIAGTEMALGAALVTPIIPKRLVGLGLLGFSAGLLSMYFRNPDMTQADGIRPSQAGTALSKDAFLAAIGASLATQK